jgi:hypothetical protein
MVSVDMGTMLLPRCRPQHRARRSACPRDGGAEWSSWTDASDRCHETRTDSGPMYSVTSQRQAVQDYTTGSGDEFESLRCSSGGGRLRGIDDARGTKPKHCCTSNVPMASATAMELDGKCNGRR